MDRNFIGSSDISCLLGLNPNKTPIELWAEKIGAVLPPDLSNNEAVEWGKRLERVVSKKFSDKHKVKLIAYKKRFYHPKYNFISCELDNIIANTEEIVEIKTTSLWNYKEWSDPGNIPALFQCQLMWELGISGREIGHIAVLIGGQRYLEKMNIKFDKKIFDEMVRRAVEFWNKYVVLKVLPEQITADDSDVLYKLYPEVTIGEDVLLPDQANIFIEQIQAQTQDLMALEKQIDKNKNEFRALLKTSEQGHTKIWRVTWKPQVSKRLDINTFKEEQQEIYNKYLKESKMRVLRYNQITKGE